MSSKHRAPNHTAISYFLIKNIYLNEFPPYKCIQPSKIFTFQIFQFFTHFWALCDYLSFTFSLKLHTSWNFLLLSPSPLHHFDFFDISNSSRTLEKWILNQLFRCKKSSIQSRPPSRKLSTGGKPSTLFPPGITRRALSLFIFLIKINKI
mgnify:CR=1 FL=1